MSSTLEGAPDISSLEFATLGNAITSRIESAPTISITRRSSEEIKNSVVIDAGRLFSTQLGSKTWMPYRNALYAGDTGWMSAFEGMEGYLNERIKVLNETVANFGT